MKSKRLAPKNTLRQRAFVRILQKELLGETRDQQSFKPCLEKLTDRKLDHGVLVQSTWSDWWHGKRMPNQSMRKVLNSVTNNLATKWLEPCITKNRLACHFCWFDIAEIAEKKSLEHATQKAFSILIELSREWNPVTSGFNGYMPNEPLYIKSTIKSARQLHYLDKDLRGKPNLSSRHFGNFDRLNPSTILIFLLNLGLEDWSNDYDTAAAIAMDFTTAMLVCMSIVHMTAPSISMRQTGDAGKIAFAVSTFWFTNTVPNKSTLSTLLGIKSITTLDIDRLLDLRQMYHSAISITGIRLPELEKLVLHSLEVILHYGIMAEVD